MSMITELAATYGVENLRFTLKEKPVHSVGLIAYTVGDDIDVEGEFEVSEERYKVATGYKIGFKHAIVGQYVLSPRAYYISDLESLIREGRASVRVVGIESIA